MSQKLIFLKDVFSYLFERDRDSSRDSKREHKEREKQDHR